MGGGGIGFLRFNSSILNIENSTVNDNKTQQTAISMGSIFDLYINGWGAGVAATWYVTLNATNCRFYNNAGVGAGGAIYFGGADAGNIIGCSFYNNHGNGTDNSIYASDGLPLIVINNSTIIGQVVCFTSPSFVISNSTIVGEFQGANLNRKNQCSFDNTIITGLDPYVNFSDSRTPFSNSAFSSKYCILGNSLFGVNKDNIISDSLSIYSTWLDTLAYNGDFTPTMKLKDISANPAIANGNPLYLGTMDQRGVVRSDKVSIGAYQWVKTTGIETTELSKSVKVYPNPVINELIIEFTGNTQNSDYEVINSLGQVVSSGKLFAKTAVSTASFTPGIYLVKLKSGDTFEFMKVIKN